MSLFFSGPQRPYILQRKREALRKTFNSKLSKLSKLGQVDKKKHVNQIVWRQLSTCQVRRNQDRSLTPWIISPHIFYLLLVLVVSFFLFFVALVIRAFHMLVKCSNHCLVRALSALSFYFIRLHPHWLPYYAELPVTFGLFYLKCFLWSLQLLLTMMSNIYQYNRT